MTMNRTSRDRFGRVEPAGSSGCFSYSSFLFRSRAVIGGVESDSEEQRMDVSQPQFISSHRNRWDSIGATVPLIDNVESDQIIIAEKKGWKNLFAYMGPGILVCIAYIDPGNFETDMQSGAQYKYELLWIILVASCAALIIQSLASRLGVVTGKHLAEHYRAEYPIDTG